MLFFWDEIHPCNRAGISQTPLRPEICYQNHTQIIAICTTIMWLAWFWGPKPQLPAGDKGEGGEERELGSAQKTRCKVTINHRLDSDKFWTSSCFCGFAKWSQRTSSAEGLLLKISVCVQQASRPRNVSLHDAFFHPVFQIRAVSHHPLHQNLNKPR